MDENFDDDYGLVRTESVGGDTIEKNSDRDEMFILENRTNNGETELYDVKNKVILRQYILKK